MECCNQIIISSSPTLDCSSLRCSLEFGYTELNVLYSNEFVIAIKLQIRIKKRGQSSAIKLRIEIRKLSLWNIVSGAEGKTPTSVLPLHRWWRNEDIVAKCI